MAARIRILYKVVFVGIMTSVLRGTPVNRLPVDRLAAGGGRDASIGRVVFLDCRIFIESISTKSSIAVEANVVSEA